MILVRVHHDDIRDFAPDSVGSRGEYRAQKCEGLKQHATLQLKNTGEGHAQLQAMQIMRERQRHYKTGGHCG